MGTFWQNEAKIANDIKAVHEQAGMEFIDENDGGPGVRLRKCQQAKQFKPTS